MAAQSFDPADPQTSEPPLFASQTPIYQRVHERRRGSPLPVLLGLLVAALVIGAAVYLTTSTQTPAPAGLSAQPAPATGSTTP